MNFFSGSTSLWWKERGKKEKVWSRKEKLAQKKQFWEQMWHWTDRRLPLSDGWPPGAGLLWQDWDRGVHARISLELGICEQGATSQIGNWWETGSARQTHKTSQPFSHLPLAGHLVPMQAEGGREGCRWRSAALSSGCHTSWLKGGASGRAGLGARLGEQQLMA